MSRPFDQQQLTLPLCWQCGEYAEVSVRYSTSPERSRWWCRPCYIHFLEQRWQHFRDQANAEFEEDS